MNWMRRAQDFAHGNGWSAGDVCDMIQGIERGHFHKSMPSERDHTVRQDVYFVPCTIPGNFLGVKLYVKFTINAKGLLLISLKESDQ